MGIERMGKKKMLDRPFSNDLSNELYILSFSSPFTWFINPNEENEKVKNLNKKIIDANMSNKLNYRVFTTIQLLIFFVSIVVFLIFSLFIDHSYFVFKFLFNIDLGEGSSFLSMKIAVGVILLLCTVAPSIYIKNKAHKNELDFQKNLPILQLFIILMLKAKRPLSEVIYVLSKTNTIYKGIFDTTYRIYLRDKKEGMAYLATAFENTKFLDTVIVLSEYGEYSKSDTLKVLENGLKDITEYTNNLKRKKDIKGNVLASFSLGIPYIGVGLLCAVPIISWGLNLMNM